MGANVVVHIYNPSSQKAKAGGSKMQSQRELCRAPSQPGLHSEILSQINKKKKEVVSTTKHKGNISTETVEVRNTGQKFNL
jgi:hypothetical protein